MFKWLLAVLTSEFFATSQAPTFTIASNAGVDGALVLGKLLEQDDLNLGFDAAKGLCLASHELVMSDHIVKMLPNICKVNLFGSLYMRTQFICST